MSLGNIHFLGVARKDADRAVLMTSYNEASEIDDEAIVRMVEQPELQLAPSTHYSFEIAGLSWCVYGDDRGRVYILIAQVDYPSRCSHSCLEELERTFIAKAGDQSLTASNGSLDRSCHSLLQKIFQKYDNVAEVDRLSQVTQKVESVKIVMQENVEMALANCVVLENIEQVTEELQQQAGVFKNNANDLRRKMWWKNLKMKLILAFVVICILTAIIVPVALWLDGQNKNDDKND